MELHLNKDLVPIYIELEPGTHTKLTWAGKDYIIIRDSTGKYNYDTVAYVEKVGFMVEVDTCVS